MILLKQNKKYVDTIKDVWRCMFIWISILKKSFSFSLHINTCFKYILYDIKI